MTSRSFRLVSLCLVACSNSAGEPPASHLDQTSRMRSLLQRTVIAGGETSDFGDGDAPVCSITSKTPIDVARARELGFPIDATLQLLAREQHAPLHWGGCSEPAPSADTTLSLSFELDQIEYVESVPFLPQGEPAHCDSSLRYRVLTTLHTDDGGLAGRFYLELGPDGGLQPGNEPSIFAPSELCIYDAMPDLRNFLGSQPVSVDLKRPHWGSVQASLCVSAEGFSGYLLPDIVYADGASPSRSRVDYLAQWPAFEGSADCSVHQEIPGPHVALDDYPGSPRPPTVALAVRADAVEPAADVEVTVRINGELAEQRTVAAGTLLELGRWGEGTTIDAEVTNVNGAGAVRSHILLDDCFQVSEQCSAPGCTASAHHVVSSQRPCGPLY